MEGLRERTTMLVGFARYSWDPHGSHPTVSPGYTRSRQGVPFCITVSGCCSGFGQGIPVLAAASPLPV
jgi:hypothetical protein